MRGGHQMASDGLADEVGEDVSRPNDKQQVKQIERAGPLLPELHKHRHGQRDVGESESCGRAAGYPLLIAGPAAHGDGQKKNRREAAEKPARERTAGESSGVCRRFADGQQEKKKACEDVEWASGHGLHAVGFGELEEFVDGESAHGGATAATADTGARTPEPAQSG